MDTSTLISKKHVRVTKYCSAISRYIEKVGHATNAMILEALKEEYPSLSATTIHRATARLAERGELAIAPSDPSGSMRYDSNLVEHDHFMCNSCGRLRDVNIADEVRPLIESQLDGCHIGGRITVSGTCKICSKKEV